MENCYISIFQCLILFSAHSVLSRFKAVRVLARMCPCADSNEPSLIENNIWLPKIVIFQFFSAGFYSSAHFYPVLKQ